jgi:hypothetical protein
MVVWRRAPLRKLYCALVQLSILFGFGPGCDQERPPPAPETTRPGTPAEARAKVLGVDAAIPPAADPPAPAGDLRAELDAFTTIDACVDARAQLDPLVGEAIDAIGYDTFLRDACRILDAAKAREPKRCASIDASSLRERCQATVAELIGDADLCPWAEPARPRLGRDPACVAIALRDARLCAGVTHSSAQTTCEAIVTHDAARCGKLLAHLEAARCERTADRWRGAVPLSSSEDRPSSQTRGSLRVETVDARSPLGIDVELGPDVRHGVVVAEKRNGAHFVVGPLSESGLDFIAPSPHVRATLAFEVLVSTQGSSGSVRRAQVQRAELVVPGHAAAATPVAHSTLKVTVSRFELTRGAPLEMSIDGTLSDSTGVWRVRGQVATFVRDVLGDDVPAVERSGPSDVPRAQ